MKAVVLLSGGLDSTTTLAIARRDGFTCHALSVDYGQRHRIELDQARQIALTLGAVEHRIVSLDLRAFGGSALTADIPVPTADHTAGIPITYVPARNTILLSLALAYAEVVGAADLFIGANVLDYSGYPDCRPEFLAAFETLARLGTKEGVEGTRYRIHAPLLRMTKAEIIRTGTALGIDYSRTISCYDPTRDGRACGVCESCRLRIKGFREAGVADPTRYAGG